MNNANIEQNKPVTIELIKKLRSLTPEERRELLTKLQDNQNDIAFFIPEDKTYYKIV